MKKTLLLLFFCFSLHSLCDAWWDAGHMAVAKIAYDRLTPKTRAEVDQLICQFADQFPESSDFVTAACFADDIKNRGLKVFNSWHICSFPYDPTCLLSKQEYQKVVSQFDFHDLRFIIKQATATLKNPDADTWSKAFMLRFLIHCVGDIHQPLHCTSLFDAHFPKGDHGGNDFAIINSLNKTKNLHAFWDSICGIDKDEIRRPLDIPSCRKLQQLVDQINYHFQNHFHILAIETDPNRWQQESYQLGRTVAYQGITPNTPLSPEYIKNSQSVAQMRIATAGLRLAQLLNDIFDNS